jgi:F-type H+-transporting ATPase subunit epsilon
MQVRIITPGATLYNQEALIITMPGELGEFSVLPGHELIIARLQAGITKITADNSIFKYFVYGGIAEVTGTYVNVLTEFAVDLSKVHKDDIEEKLVSLRVQMNNEKDEINIKAIQADITQNESLLSFLASSI